MKKITIFPGEPVWSAEGMHILDDQGFAILATKEMECDILPEHYERVCEIIKHTRESQKKLPLDEIDEKKDEQNDLKNDVQKELQNKTDYDRMLLSAKQFRLALLELGWLDRFESAIKNLKPDELKKKIKIEWEYGTEFDLKNNENIKIVLNKMELAEDEINLIFKTGIDID